MREEGTEDRGHGGRVTIRTGMERVKRNKTRERERKVKIEIRDPKKRVLKRCDEDEWRGGKSKKYDFRKMKENKIISIRKILLRFKKRLI